MVGLMKDRRMTREEKRWVIDYINRIPCKVHEKTGKLVKSRKALTAKYDECWKTLMGQDFPPSLGSVQELCHSIKRENERVKRMQGNVHACVCV